MKGVESWEWWKPDAGKKYPNIAPEWQIKQPQGLVDSDVARVKEKYNDSYTLRGHF